MEGEDKMTIQEVVSKLQKEQQNAVASRFPCRAIMVKNIPEYCELISELKKISDISFVPMSDLFANTDIMPRYENLKAAKFQDKWLILTGVSEYLRLFAQNEISDRRFATLWAYQAPASSTGRIIIPLWGCEAKWFDKAMNLTGDLRQEDFFFDCSAPESEEQKLSLLVFSGKFDKYISSLEAVYDDLKKGLQAWFEYWLNPAPNKTDFVLITKRANCVDTTDGNISINVIDNMLAFIKEHLHGADVLTSENCPSNLQSVLFDYNLKHGRENLDAALLGILNVSSFNGADVMAKWENIPDSHKQAVYLWLELHPNSTYLCHCFACVASLADIPKTIMLEIFKVGYDKPEWVSEHKTLAKVMGLKPGPRFFKELDTIPDYENRLEFMQGKERGERVYLLRMVGKWMRSDYTQVLSCEKLAAVYPELYYYLRDKDVGLDDDIKLYMERYKSYKLANILPEDESAYFSGIDTDTYEMRYAILSDYIDADTAILWVDALGVEWLPLLRWGITRNCDVTVKCITIGQANLPTETKYNDQWSVMGVPYEKVDKLDKLAHRGVVDEPDYYTCIEEQLEFVSSVYEEVSKMMERYHRVIVTGDHGTSRLAARFFHKRDGFDVDRDVKVYSHGRYCEWKQTGQLPLATMSIAKANDGKQYAVFTNYDHFTQSGFAAGADDENAIYGEVHGGASPEEMLVPILVLDSNKKIPLTANWEKPTVKISRKKVQLCVRFSKPVSSLQVRLAGIDGVVNHTEDNTRWVAEFSGITPGTYSPQMFANNMIVSVSDVTIKPALGGGEGDLP